MKCPVCDKENRSMLCSECDFDSSRDYGKYPTFGPVGNVPTVSALRRQWQGEDKPEKPIINEPESTKSDKLVFNEPEPTKSDKRVFNEPEPPMPEAKPDFAPVVVQKKKPVWVLCAGAVLILGAAVFLGSKSWSNPEAPEPGIQDQVQTQPSEVKNQTQQPESVCYLRADSEQIKVGETTNVAFVSGEYVYRSDDALTWSSSDPAVATVNQSGTVTGVSAGTAVITGMLDGSEGAIAITVEEIPVGTPLSSVNQTVPQVSEIQLECRTDVLLAGDTVDVRLKTDGFYIDGDSDGIEWSTDRPEIATVDSQGRVTGRNAGKFQLTAKYQGLSSTMEMTVVQVDSNSGVVAELDYEKLSMRTGNSDTVNLTVRGNLPEHCGLTAYYSSGMQLSLEVGEQANPIQLNIHAFFSEVSEGYVTILLYDRDDPSHVVAAAKVQLKIN